MEIVNPLFLKKKIKKKGLYYLIFLRVVSEDPTLILTISIIWFPADCPLFYLNHRYCPLPYLEGRGGVDLALGVSSI